MVTLACIAKSALRCFESYIPQFLTRWESKLEKRISLRAKLGPAVLIFLFVSAIYLYAFPQANLVYPAVVLAHAGLGLLATVGILWQVLRSIKSRDWLMTTSWFVLGIGAIIGAALIYLGTSRPELRLLHIHIFASLLGGVLLLALWLQSRKKAGGAAVLALPSSWAGDRGSRDCSGMSISTRQSLGGLATAF